MNFCVICGKQTKNIKCCSKECVGRLNVELKGSRFGNRDKKLELLHKEHPNFPIKIIDGEVYKILKDKYISFISNWE